MRPVSSMTRSSVADGSSRSISKCVRASRGSVGVDRHQHPVAPVAADRRVDRPRSRRRVTVDQRQVLAAQPPRGDQRLQRAVDRVALGDDQQTRGVAVEAMDDSGPPRLLAAGRAPVQRLRERAGAVPAGGVDDDAGRLVDDEQVLVLVGDRERRRRRARTSLGSGAGSSHLDPLARLDRRDAWGASARRPGPARRRSGSAPGRAIRAARRESGRAACRRSRPDRDLEPLFGHGAHRSHRCRRSRRLLSSTHSSASTPNVIAMSATLNAGQAGA